MRFKTSVIIMALIAVMAGVLLPGCAGGAKDKVLVIGTTDSAATLDPADCYDYFASNILFNVAETLVDVAPGTADLVPKLATEWTPSADGLSYTFKIREGVKFTDGTTMDANAVKFSLDRAKNITVDGQRGQPSFLLDVIREVTVTGDYEVKIDLSYPCAPFVSMLGYTVGSIISPTAYTTDAWMPTAVVATGPYKLTGFVEGSQMTLERNTDYWGDAPFAERVVVKFFTESSAMKMALENGEIDVAYRSFIPAEEDNLLANTDLAAERGQSPGMRFMVLNVSKAPFKNIHVRKAIAYSVDRAGINETAFQGTVSPVYSMIPDGMWGYEPTFKDVYGEAPNLEKAKEELAAAGYSASKPLAVDLWYTTTHYGSTEKDLAQVLKSQLEATGVFQVNLQASEWGRYIDDLMAGSMGLCLLGWYPDYLDPDDYVTPFYTEQGAISEGSFYNSADMTALISEQLAETTLADRTATFAEIQDLAAADLPYIPLFQKPQFVAEQKDVKGVMLEPLMILRYYLIYKDGWK